MRLQGVIFDMDGVLADTERLHGVAQESMLREWKVDLPARECSRRFAGMPEKDIWPIVFAEAKLPCPPIEDLMRKKVETMLELLREHIPPIPGARDVVSRVRALNLKTAVASSSDPALIERILMGLELHVDIESITAGREVKHGKPAPDIFLLAAKKLDTPPEHCLVIEDAHAGVRAAKAAGMTCIGYKAKESRQDLSEADIIVSSMDEITKELLESL